MPRSFNGPGSRDGRRRFSPHCQDRHTNAFPVFDGFTRIGDLKQVIGALLTIVLIVAMPRMIFSDIICAIATSTGNYAAAGKARTGVLIAVAAAALAGSRIAWVNWFITIGKQL